MGKCDSAAIERIKPFEFTGKKTRLMPGDMVKFSLPNGRPASISFSRKDDPMLFHGYPVIEHPDLKKAEDFEDWFKDFASVYGLRLNVDCEAIEKDHCVFKVIED